MQLIAALVNEPDLLVLDEPFSGLDPIAMGVMADLLTDVAATGATVLFSSHQLDLVEDLCEDVVIIDRGRVVLAGELDELRAGVAQRFVDIHFRRADPGLARVSEGGGSRGDGRPGPPSSRPAHRSGRARGRRAGCRRDPLVRLRAPTLSELFREAVTA